MHWEVDGKSGKRLSEIAAAVKGADRLILATDPDREGEAISWHVLEVLRGKRAVKDKPVERVVFNAITKDAVLDAMRHPRQIDADWSTPISPAARSTISSASRCRRCCGASCPARARPAACSRWRSAWSATARTRSRSSSRRNTGRSRSRSRRRPAAASSPAPSASTARSSAGSTSPTRRRPAPSRRRSAPAPTASPRSRRSRSGATRRRPSPPRPCSRRPRASSASPPPAPCRSPSASTRTAIITYMRTDGVHMAPEAIAATRAAIAQALRRPLPAGDAAPLPDQGEERAGGPRGDPPDRPVARRRHRSAARSRPTRRGSTS